MIRHITNQGVSVSRNTGLNNATGEYIAFVDSDDTVELDMYRRMFNSLVERKADVCICQLRLIDHPGAKPRSIVDNSYEGIYDNSYDMIRMLYNEAPSVYKDKIDYLHIRLCDVYLWHHVYYTKFYPGIIPI